MYYLSNEDLASISYQKFNKKIKFKSANSQAFTRTAGQNVGTGIGKAKAYGHNTALSGSIPPPKQGDNDIWIQNFSINPQTSVLIDKLVEEYPVEYN